MLLHNVCITIVGTVGECRKSDLMPADLCDWIEDRRDTVIEMVHGVIRWGLCWDVPLCMDTEEFVDDQVQEVCVKFEVFVAFEKKGRTTYWK